MRLLIGNFDVHACCVPSEFATCHRVQVPHDKLNLRQPVWVSAVKFLEPFHTIVSGTAFHQVRLYDIRAQARPVLDLEVGKHAVTCVQPVSASCVGAWGDLPLKRMKGEPNSPHGLASINTPYVDVNMICISVSACCDTHTNTHAHKHTHTHV